ncbi:hypothetical protein BGZ73_000167 [Actinomortierella ambigua]|nr:hypothetical protein BGZ73_000167 [Actinomortierella ambigua]
MFVQHLGLDHPAQYLLFLSPRVTQLLRDTGGTTSTSEDLPATASSPSSYNLFTNLKSLELRPFWGHPIPDLDQRITTLVLHNPGIKTFKTKVGVDPNVLVSLVTEYMPHLTHLKVAVKWHGNVKALLYNLPSCIQTVKFKYFSHEPEPLSVRDRDRSTMVVRRHWDLESLFIYCNFAQQEVDVMLPSLENCSRKLRYVDEMGLQFLMNSAIADTLENIGYAWEKLFWPYSLTPITDAELAPFVRRSTQWTIITLPIQTTGPLTVAAIFDRCQHLEKLVIDRHGSPVTGLAGFMEHHLQAILSKASSLKYVQVGWSLQDRMISAMDILSSEWATTSLEHLEFRIRFERTHDVATANSIQ